MIDKDRLREKLTEMTAYKFDMLEQQFSGKYPPFKNHGIERYKGIEVPPPYIVLNTFKNTVDDHVSLIMMLLDEEIETAHPKTGLRG